jgi:signal transduction histidine kinase
MPSERPARHGPWFWSHPRVAIGVAGALTAAISLLRFSVDGVEDSIANLYALPVALVALTSGRRAGLMAGVAASGLLLWWVLAADQHLTPLGWTSRVVPLVLLGGLVGDAADRVRSADLLERRARALEALGRDTAELHDSLLQHLAVAKWRLESGDAEHGLDSITDAMADGQELIRQLLGSDSVLPGDHRRSLSASRIRPTKPSAS